MKFKQWITRLLVISFLSCCCVNAQNKYEIDIPLQKFVLKNGLTVIISEDHSTPTVSINIWYHVGSKNEKPGKTGFAHLFEHLMFQKSEHSSEDYLQAMQKLGATNLNGTTNIDRTNFFETVPINMFEKALWMESDRMVYLLGEIDQAVLDEQRSVVQNEKRQGLDKPYGKVREQIAKSTYPAGHPYSWITIGSMEDLNAASVDDVKEWFNTYYGPSNAVIAIVGDINTQEAYSKVNKYFGEIPPGPPLIKQQAWVAEMTESKLDVVYDNISQPTIIKVWNVPGWGTREVDMLDLFADMISNGKTSPLYKKFVYDEQTATQISASVNQNEISSQFMIQAGLKPGEDVKKISEEIDKELKRIIKTGFTEEELLKTKTRNFSRVVRALESSSIKADWLAKCQTFGDDAGFYKVIFSRLNNAVIQDIISTAGEWLAGDYYEMNVLPFPSLASEKDTVDRTRMPEESEKPEFHFPEIRETKLSNGLRVLLAERHTIPIVNFNLVFNTGSSTDGKEKAGLAGIAMSMLTEGTNNLSSLQINDKKDKLGAQLGASAGMDNSSIYLSSLKANLTESLNLFAEVLLSPSFSETELERLKKQQIAGIEQAMSNAAGVGGQLFGSFLMGKNHPYSLPGGGYVNTVEKIARDDVIEFYDNYLTPDNAVLVIAGDITLKEIEPELEKVFNNWNTCKTTENKIDEVTDKTKRVVYILDQPGMTQSVIFAGNLFPYPDDLEPTEKYSIKLMNNTLGGQFASRINLNLREDKHWSYGAHSGTLGGRQIEHRAFFVNAKVQADKTKESMLEIKKELSGIISSEPVTKEELEKNRDAALLNLLSSGSSINGVLGNIVSINVNNNLPLDYFDYIQDYYNDITLKMVNDAAKKVVHPDKLTWLIVGDRSKIEEGIESLNFGEVKIIDKNGEIVE